MDIHKIEVITYFILWSSAVLYAIYGVFDARKKFETFDDLYGDFEQGWLNDRKKDVADYEWETSCHILNLIWPWALICLIISEIIRNICIKALTFWQLAVVFVCITYNCGVTGMLIIISQPVLFKIFCRFRSKSFIWICEGICLLLMCCLKVLQFPKEQMFYLNDAQHYMIVVATYWINLRCLSYCIDNVYSEKHSFLLLLLYCVYLPTLFFGPFIKCSSFENREKYRLLLSKRLYILLFNMVRFGFWFLVTELLLHYLYVNALSYQPQMVRSLSSWALYGYGYCMGQFFHLKYVILYGFSTSLGKFEGVNVPSTPKCIGRIHLYSDMWKYFDQGLYNFLIKYIYKPTLGNGFLHNKIFSSFLCFLFVYIWHGIQNHILVWVILNFLGIVLENLFITLWKKNSHKITLNPWWKSQIICIVTSPLLAMSAVSNFYFFAGTQIGNIFVERFFYGPSFHSLLLLLFLYCCSHTSINLKKWEKTNYDKKKCV